MVGKQCRTLVTFHRICIILLSLLSDSSCFFDHWEFFCYQPKDNNNLVHMWFAVFWSLIHEGHLFVPVSPHMENEVMHCICAHLAAITVRAIHSLWENGPAFGFKLRALNGGHMEEQCRSVWSHSDAVFCLLPGCDIWRYPSVLRATK